MKKLSLKQLNLEPGALLQKEQLKTVFGGYDDHGCIPPSVPCACYEIGGAGGVIVGCSMTGSCFGFCDE